MQANRSFAATITLLLAAILPAAAQAPQNGGLADICKAEIAGCGPLGPRCLFEKDAKLGAECAAAVAIVRERRERLRAACKEDAEKLCQGQAPKAGAMVQCLRAKQAELSKACAEALAALPSATARP